jgi:DNA-binding PadR family transcriptional regulator
VCPVVSTDRRRSPLAFAILSTLEIGPLHPYAIQRLLTVWGKGEVINLGQRATLYRTIKQLHDAGLIEIAATERDQRFPERTIYRVTEAGQQTRREWLNQALSTPADEFPLFPAALSFTMLLPPPEARALLTHRLALLEDRLRQLNQDLDDRPAELPRVSALETEYKLAVTTAERDWVKRVADDLASSDLTWGWELAEAARAFLPEAGIPTQEDPAAGT